jgi:TonB family protein
MRAAEENHTPTGGSEPDMESVVESMAADLRRCYEAGLERDPSRRGRVRLTIRVGPGGEVTSVTPSSSGLLPEVVACIAARMRAAQFRPPTEGGATVAIPLTFASGP